MKRILRLLPSVPLAVAALGCTVTSVGPSDGGPPVSDGGPSLPDGGTSDGSALPEASAPDGAPPPGSACAAPPEIHGNLAPAWSFELGNGFMGGVATDSAGNVLVGGAALGPLHVGAQSFAAPDAGGHTGPFLLKLDAAGHVVWYRGFTGQGNVTSVGVDGADDVYIAGTFHGGDTTFSTTPAPGVDLGNGPLTGTLFIAKLSPSGTTLWSRAFQPYDGASGNYATSGPALAVDAAGNLAIMDVGGAPYVFGAHGAGASTDTGFLASFDPSGATRYSKVFDGMASGASLAFDSAGNLLVTGEFHGALDLGASLPSPTPGGGSTAFVARIGPTGSVQWQLADGTFSSGAAAASGASGAFIAGTFNGTIGLAGSATAQGGGDLFFAGLDGSGHPTFETTVAAGSDNITALASAPGGGVVATGTLGDVVDFGGGLLMPPGVVLAKLDASGKHVFSARFGTAPYTSLTPGRPSVAVDASGRVVAAGAFNGAIDLGGGILAGEGSFLDSTMYVAAFTQQAPPPPVARATCPLPIDGGLPDAGRFVAAGAGYLIDGLALSPDSVYWTNGGDVMGAPLDGGAPVVFSHGQRNAHALATDARTLYWANAGSQSYAGLGPGHDGTIVAAPLDGGVPTTLATGQDVPGALAVDDASVYWAAGGATLDDGGTTPGAILSVPLGGGTPAVLVAGLGLPGPIAVHGDTLVFASVPGPAPALGGAVSSLIQSVPRSGGTPTTVTTTDRIVDSIAVDATTVYWIDDSTSGVDTTSADGRIRCAALAGGPPTILASNQARPADLILVGSTLLWANQGTGVNLTPGGNAGVWSLPASGGTPAAFIDQRIGVGPLAADAQHMAWFETLDPDTALTALFVADR